MSYPKYQAKAGRFLFDSQTRKVRVSKEQGRLTFFTNSQGENHVSWVNLESKLQQIQLMLFPFDAHFTRLASQNNTYLLKFDSNEDKYFFYLQEKIEPEEFVRRVNERIAFVPPEEMELERGEQELRTPQKAAQGDKIEEEIPREPENRFKAINTDFITRITNNLMAANKKGEGDITALSKILTHESISLLLAELSEGQKLPMLEFLPEEQRQTKHIASNLRSPQFQQAVEVLSDALNSENVIALFMELGLDQKHLKKHFGVHAFLLALQEWAQKQPAQKMEEEKEES